MGNLTYFDIAAGCVGVYLLKRYLSKSSLPPLPPGPKGLPLIGNVLDMPTQKDWETYAQWGDTFGESSPQRPVPHIDTYQLECFRLQVISVQ